MSFLQRIFRRPDYRSDVTQFIEQLKTEKPGTESKPGAPCSAAHIARTTPE